MGIRPDEHEAGAYQSVPPISKAHAAAVAANPEAKRIHVERLEKANNGLWDTL